MTQRQAFIDEWVARGVFSEGAREAVDRYLEAQDDYGAAVAAHEEAQSEVHACAEWRQRANTRFRKATAEVGEVLGWTDPTHPTPGRWPPLGGIVRTGA